MDLDHGLDLTGGVSNTSMFWRVREKRGLQQRLLSQATREIVCNLVIFVSRVVYTPIERVPVENDSMLTISIYTNIFFSDVFSTDV